MSYCKVIALTNQKGGVGRKKSCIIKLGEIEKISSLHRKENEDNAHLIKNPIVFAFLHRQL